MGGAFFGWVGRTRTYDLLRDFHKENNAFGVVRCARLQCPVCALARTPALHTDRGTRCACALSAIGSAQARDPTSHARRSHNPKSKVQIMYHR